VLPIKALQANNSSNYFIGNNNARLRNCRIILLVLKLTVNLWSFLISIRWDFDGKFASNNKKKSRIYSSA